MLIFDFHSSLHKQLRLNERFIKRKLSISLFIHPLGKFNVLIVTEYLINMQNTVMLWSISLLQRFLCCSVDQLSSKDRLQCSYTSKILIPSPRRYLGSKYNQFPYELIIFVCISHLAILFTPPPPTTTTPAATISRVYHLCVSNFSFSPYIA